MKKFLFLIIALLLIGCGSIDKILNAGKIANTDYKEIIPFNYDYNFALIDVEINSKKYTFLVDTGAPTLISSTIYKDLNIETEDYVAVEDSQGQINTQEVVVIPEMKIGNLIYNNTGAIVSDMRDVFEFNCMQIDGIIGATQMAKSFWKFDYQNKEITISNQLSKYDITTFKDTLSFAVSGTKTPYIRGHVNGKETLFTYDTGFGGHIDVNKRLDDFKNATGYTIIGNSGVGLYGAVDSTKIRSIKADSLRIGHIEMAAQKVDLDHSGLIGNDFMNKYEIIMDWTAQNIYLKKLKDFETTEQNSFGFKFRIKENKAVVTGIIKEYPIDLKLGDVILSINEFDYQNITDSNACEIWNSTTYKGLESINVTYLRNDVIKETTLKKIQLMD
ncbi:aspartyl protease family protein [Nonlabens sp.]|uniref:aspartyl protease family protein n=1 Tax=Nonlabens sp. TaxID=1888209 RepID=UPI003F695002